MTAGGRESALDQPYDAVVLDMDGVVTDTAWLHAAAWKALFDAILTDPRAASTDHRPFDPVDDYRRYVDGRAREDGVVAFLESRGVEAPRGDPRDGPGSWTVHGFAARKNELFLALVATQGVHVFPGTAALVGRLRAAGIPLGLVTASRNAAALLDAAGLRDAFDVVVDGVVMAHLGLAGKPDPAGFLEAARRLGVAPERAAVIEDAVAGVQAAAAGGFGLVVGIDRAHRRRDLEQAGADVVLDDVAELDLGASRGDPWRLVYTGFDPAKEAHREALTALGNGYLATRGSRPERVDDGVHYPGTYLAGVYDRLTSTVDGVDRVDEEIVNAPSWLPFDVRIEDGGWWSEGGLGARDERHELDLRRGLLTRTLRLVDAHGRSLRVEQRRLVSMERQHLAAMQTTLVADGWSGRVTVRTGIDASVVNGNDVESHLLAHRHLRPVGVERLGGTLLVVVRTVQSEIQIATAARTTVAGATTHPQPDESRPDESRPDESQPDESQSDATHAPGTPSADGGPDVPRCGRHLVRHELTVADGRPVVVETLVAVVTSRDAAVASPRDGALAELDRDHGGFDEILRRHALAWTRLWEHFAVRVETDDPVQLALNLHVFHMLQAVSPHTAFLDAGIPARGLHGEGYRGHVFWDELFVLPLYSLRAPAVARALLDYRWRRLDAARQAAGRAGLRGAMFPWQSGSDGRDETPRALYNPRSGRWIPDCSWRQRHVGLAVAYNAWQHVQATDDTVWLAERGGELILEVARYFADLATEDAGDGRFHIAGVMGPDEFHDGYPGAPGEGLRDNAYTNVLTAWVCRRAIDALAALQTHERDELVERIGLGPDEVDRWREIGARIAVPFHDGVISQFDGYGELAELDWEHYRRVYGHVERLDLILEAEGDSPNRYRLSKQADVLMLLYLLGPDGLVDVLAGLGYPMSPGDLDRTVDYYLARSAHGSTLSRVVQTSVLATLDRPNAWAEFREALDADLDDTQRGTTGRGIHLGAMAGTVDLVLRGFTGMRVRGDALVVDPHPPDELRAVSFEVRFRDQRIAVALGRTRLRLAAQPGAGRGARVVVGPRSVLLQGGESVTFPVRTGRAEPGEVAHLT